MGRLQYFLWTVIFGPLLFSVAACIGIFFIVFVLDVDNKDPTFYALVAPFVIMLFWVALSLQAVRIRDIGWRPGVIIPVMFAINFLDFGVAYLAPSLADGTGLHTIVPTIIGILYALVLQFTPTDGHEMVPFIIPGLSLPSVNLDIFHKSPPEPPVQPKPRQQSFEERRYPRGKVPFGRRGLT